MEKIKINPYIFREYDIRGVANTDLTDEVVELIGKSYGSYISGKEVIVGMDNRLSSTRIKNALIKGLISTGKDVIDIGLTLSPILYYSRILYGIDGAIMITGSHIAANYNGFKICKGKHTIFGEQIQDILKIIQKGDFATGECGKVEKKDPFPEYAKMIKEKIKLDKKFKVALDCGNGTAGMFATKILESWGCEVIPLYCESDGSFPVHNPDPTKIDSLKYLINKIKEEKADLGIGIDGDGDRIGVLDEKGKIIWGDMLQILYQREVLLKHPGAKVIIEVKCSQALYDEVVRLGGKPIFWKTGHSLIKDKMLKENALVSGEMSGHMFFSDEYFGIDDALYAAGRLLRIMSDKNKSLSDLFADVPQYFATPELRPYCPDEEKFSVVKKVVADFKKKYDVIDIDGARIVFNDGWGLVRASNTQPALIIRAEGKTPEALDRIKEIIENKMRELAIAFSWDEQGD